MAPLLHLSHAGGLMGKKKTSKRAAPKKRPIRNLRKNLYDEGDIVGLILNDHKPLKTLIKTLKDTKEPYDERRAAFEDFAKLLTVHALAEEQVLYTDLMRKRSIGLREETYEASTEHAIARDMIERTRVAEEDDRQVWTANAKVLAEMVEHHLKKEEKTFLKDFEKSTSIDERFSLGHEYLARKAELEDSDDIPEDHFYTYSRSLAQ